MKHGLTFLLLLSTPCLASSPLLSGLPPCPAPADLPTVSGVEHPSGGDSLAAPADLGGPPPPLSMEIPLGIPVTRFTDQPAADLSLSQVPVGKATLRDGQAEIEVLGRSSVESPAQTDCIPAAQLP